MADLSITAASVVPGSGAKEETGIAGESITAGQVVYKDSADNKFKLADTDSATAAARIPYGIALHAASANQPLTVLTSGSITIGATIAAATPYFLSGTAGAICPYADVASGDYTCLIGMGLSTTVLNVSFLGGTVVMA